MNRGESIRNRKNLFEFEVKIEKPSDTQYGAWEEPIPKKIRDKKCRWTVPLIGQDETNVVSLQILNVNFHNLAMYGCFNCSLSRFSECKETLTSTTLRYPAAALYPWEIIGCY